MRTAVQRLCGRRSLPNLHRTATHPSEADAAVGATPRRCIACARQAYCSLRVPYERKCRRCVLMAVRRRFGFAEPAHKNGRFGCTTIG